MRTDNFKDTIAAVSTAPGEAAVGIVRLSGPEALKIADAVFAGKKKDRPSEFKTYTVHYGKIVNAGSVLDEVIMTVMRQPHSYTREDVVEINCHGGPVALRGILECVLAKGCRLASPGEFTRRAFLNGRIDLAQAEAVIDIIRAKTDSALTLGLEQLKGGLSKEISGIRGDLLDILVILEAGIDFPEEDLDLRGIKEISRRISAVEARLDRLLESARSGRILREGIRVVICGKPNVGKSSLLNSLLRKERSIVTSVAGTTRDSIEEMIDIKGVPVRIVDTAGIFRARGLVEKKAVKRARSQIRIAELVLLMFDSSRALGDDDRRLIKQLKDKNVIAVINKIDLKARLDQDEIRRHFRKVVGISARQGKNIDLLEEALFGFAYGGAVSSEPILVSNLRHISALKEARKLISHSLASLAGKLSTEFISQDLKDASIQLDMILGKDLSADLLERIFSDFCIGK